MKVVVLYHPKSDHGGVVEDYAHEYRRLHNRKMELVSLETKDGAATASLYDVVRYPAVLAIADDGSLQSLWQGLPMPLMNEVDQYSQGAETMLAKAQMLSTTV